MLMVVVHRITFFKTLNQTILIDEESDVHCFQWQSVLAIHSSIFRSLGWQKKTQLQWQTLQWQFRAINHNGRGENRGWSGVSSHRASELTRSCYQKWNPLWPITAVILYISQPDLTLASLAGLVGGPSMHQVRKKHSEEELNYISMPFKAE